MVVVSPDFRKKMTLARHKLGKWIHQTPSQLQLPEKPIVVTQGLRSITIYAESMG